MSASPRQLECPTQRFGPPTSIWLPDGVKWLSGSTWSKLDCVGAAEAGRIDLGSQGKITDWEIVLSATACVAPGNCIISTVPAVDVGQIVAADGSPVFGQVFNTPGT